MRSSFLQYWWLWILAWLVSLSFSFLPINSSSFDLLNHYWIRFDQNLKNQLQPRNFDQSIEILNLAYPNRYEFWFDSKTKRDLANFIQSFKGQVILNLDPHQILNDPVLQPILENKNVIRPIRFYYGEYGDPQIEEGLAQYFENQSRSPYGDRVSISPKTKSYYDPTFSFGMSILKREEESSIVTHFPMSMKASFYQIPSAVLSAYSNQQGCKQWAFKSMKEIACKNQNLHLPVDLPLRFYRNPIPYKNRIEDLSAESKFLIVDITDPSTRISSPMNLKNIWSQIAATALSNLSQNDFPKQSPFYDWSKNLIFLSLCLFLMWISLRFRLAQNLTASLGGAVVLFGFVIISSLFFNIESSPIPLFFAYSLFALCGISTRSLLDLKERRLVEKALSGYVSEERLKGILSGSETLKLEGRQTELVTLLIDIQKFSMISKHLSPPAIFKFVQDFFEVVDPIIFEFGGTIDKKMGDGMLAFFGDGEMSYESAAQSAVKAALKIQSQLKTAGLKDPQGNPIKSRIGINGGKMFIGNAGSHKHFNYTVLGEAVNFTQRLEAACPSGEVLVGATLRSILSRHFKLEALEIQVKNETEKVTAYRVLSETPQ